MAPSAQAGSSLEIRLVASGDEAKRDLAGAAQEIGRALRGVGDAATAAGRAGAEALGKTAEAGRRAAEEVGRVGEKAKLSAGQLRMVAAGMAGMALGAYGAYQDAHGGRSAGAAYAQGAISGGLQGASMGMMLGGPKGALALGLGGAGLGALTTYWQREAAEKAEAKAREESIASMREQVELYEELRARTESFQATLAALGSAETDAATRSEALGREIERREAEDARLAEAQRAAADAGDKEAFAKASRDRQLGAQELAALRRVRVEEDAAAEGGARGGRAIDIGPVDSWARKGMDLAGAASGVSDAQLALSREANGLAKQQLETQRALVSAVSRLSAGGGPAQWG